MIRVEAMSASTPWKVTRSSYNASGAFQSTKTLTVWPSGMVSDPPSTPAVFDFVGVGDGVTDNAAAFTAAVAAITSAGQGILRVPAGQYVTSKTILAPSGFTLELLEGATVTWPSGHVGTDSGTNRSLVYVGAGVTDVAIIGAGTLDGRSADTTTTRHCVYINGGARVRLDGVTLTSTLLDGVYLTGDARDIEIGAARIENVTRSGVVFIDCVDVRACGTRFARAQNTYFDIEPETSNHAVRRVQLLRCTMTADELCNAIGFSVGDNAGTGSVADVQAIGNVMSLRDLAFTVGENASDVLIADTTAVWMPVPANAPGPYRLEVGSQRITLRDNTFTRR